MNTPATQAYLDYLSGKQSEFITEMNQSLNRQVEVAFQYLNVLNAMAVSVSPEEAALLAQSDGVKAVYPDTIQQMDTDEGPLLIGAPAIWNGDTYSGQAYQGEAIIIGVIDSGINHAHPSFADVGGDGYDHTNPYGSGNYVGWCVANPSFCNDKLIGAYGLNPVGDNPEDTDGHGSHTASTAGGNRHEAAIPVGTDVFTFTIQGVAPHANLIAYKVCNPDCPSSASIAAVNYAISDGADVLNFSISGSANPWANPVDLAFLEAYDAGIFVSASAGNNGPGAGTVAHNGPWNATVAASTHQRVAANALDVTGPVPVPPELLGLAAVPGENVVIATEITGTITYDPANLDGCAAFPPGFFTDMIALIQRGTCTFAQKVANAAAAGAVAVVVYNNVGGPPVSMAATPATPPSVMLDLSNGQTVKDYIDSNPPDSVTVLIDDAGTVIYNPDWQDIMAGFSSRGPTLFDLIKPDYSAPGVNILAAFAAQGGDPVQYAFEQGTSMSSPHGAGSAALVIGLNPTWSPAEVKSALAMTSNPSVLRDSDGVTPADLYDMGSGRLQLSGAGRAGLVMNETYENYLAADPAIGGDPKTLNQPSMVNFDCIVLCTWTRVVSNTLDVSMDWSVSTNITSSISLTVDPAVFTLAPGTEQVLTITADTTAAVQGDTYFGDILLTPGDPTNVASAHLPVVVIPSATAAQISIFPTQLESTQPPVVSSQLLTISNLGELPLNWELFEEAPPTRAPEVDWNENFDSYLAGSDLHGQGGWHGWDNNPGAGALVSDVQSHSSPNSVDINGASDLVHEYTGYDTSFWAYTAWQYIPSGFNGDSFFILLSNYTDLGPYNWSVQVRFDSVDGQVVNEGVSGGTLPLITDQWVEIRVEIDLVNDQQSFYYGGNLLYSGTWTGEQLGGGILNIAAVDLFANGASTVYYDDISLVENAPQICDVAGDVPWLSEDPDSGTNAGGESSLVDVGFDATGLGTGVYTATLCLASNDAITPIIPIPITMTVVPFVYAVDLQPDTSAQSGDTGSLVDYTLQLTNNGNYTDTFELGFSGNTWDVTLPVTTTALGSGETTDIHVEVNVPPEALGGDIDIVTVTVASLADPLAMDQSVLTTTAVLVPAYNVELAPAEVAESGAAGETVSYHLMVTNTGNITDTYSITATAGWEVGLPVTGFSLGPGESAPLTVNVDIPVAAVDGESDVTTVTIMSETVPELTDVSTLTTTAIVPIQEGGVIFLPVILYNNTP